MALSSAATDLSRPTNKGTIICGKTTMSRRGRTGKVWGTLHSGQGLGSYMGMGGAASMHAASTAYSRKFLCNFSEQCARLASAGIHSQGAIVRLLSIVLLLGAASAPASAIAAGDGGTQAPILAPAPD